MFTSFVLACLAPFLKVDSFRFSDNFYQLIDSINSQELRSTITNAPQYLVWALLGLLILLCTVAAWIPPYLILKEQGAPLFAKIIKFRDPFFTRLRDQPEQHHRSCESPAHQSKLGIQTNAEICHPA